MLAGYKSYIMAAAAVVYAAAGYFTGTLDVHAAIAFAIGGGAIASLRSALPTTVASILGPILDAIEASNKPADPPK